MTQHTPLEKRWDDFNTRLKAQSAACEGIPTDQLQPGSVKALVDAARSCPQYIVLAYREGMEIGLGRNTLAICERNLNKINAALAPFEENKP